MKDPIGPSENTQAPSHLSRDSEPLGTTDHPQKSDSTKDSGSVPFGKVVADSTDLPEIPGYQVFREIARGGMGRVLEAHDINLDRHVALKLLLPGAKADRFVREAKITARLPHPGIPPVHALGTLKDGSPFLAMKLIVGETLAEEMVRSDRPRLLHAFNQICQAVGFAHSRGIIHRDLKPSNIMVGAFGEVQVMDWGLAKEINKPESLETPSSQRETSFPLSLDPNQTTAHLVSSGSTDHQTMAGQVMGTPAYMAPEQARGEATDTRTDVFSLGGILCTILTGQPPFGGKSSLDVLKRAGAGDLEEAHAKLATCGADKELIDLCRHCLNPNPGERPNDGQAVADRLTAYLDRVQERLQKAERDRAVALIREVEQRKRRQVQLALVAAVGLLLMGGLVFAWWEDRRATDQKAQARNKLEQANQSVDAALKLVPDLRKQYRFDTARKSLEQAAVVAKDGAPNRVSEVEQAIKDLAFVIRLDDIRFRKQIWTTDEKGKGGYNLKIAAPQYRETFAAHGIDISRLEGTEAANRTKTSAVKANLIAALDDWALYETDPLLRNRLLEVARLADPGPWKDRFRDPAIRSDKSALQKLEAEVDPQNTTPETLSILAELLRKAGFNPIKRLTAAHNDYPDNFELAFSLGMSYTHNTHFDSKNAAQAIGTYEAARALRPENLAVWNNLAYALVLNGQSELAVPVYRQINRLDPEFEPAHFNLGLTLRLTNQLEEAIASYHKAISLNPNHAEAHNNLAIVLHELGKTNDAISSYQKAISIDPSISLFHYNLGNAVKGKNRNDEAISCFRKSKELDPAFAPAHYNLGIALRDKGETDEAIVNFKQATSLDPNLYQAHYDLGFALEKKNQLTEAIESYKKAIAINPNYVLALNQIGITLTAKGDFDEAMSYLRKAIQLDPNNPMAHSNLGTILCNYQKDYDGAIASFRKALKLDPKFPKLHFNLGKALEGKGEEEEAIASFKKATEGNPKHAEAHGSLGLLLIKSGQLEEAIESLEKATELDPKYGGAFNDLGKALFEKGQLNKAIASFRKSVLLQPDYPPAHNNLGNALFAKRQLEESIACFRKAISLDPNYAPAHVNLGIAMEAKGQGDEAIACFRKAISIDPKTGSYHYHLGLALAGKGEGDEVINEYKTAIRLDPELAEAHCNLGSILRSRGDYDAALQMYQKGHDLGSQRSGWPYPSAQWVAQAKREVAQAKRLPAVLKGEEKPASNGERLFFAQLAQNRRHYSLATRLFDEAIASDPKIATDRRSSHRYNAACSACQAAAGQGKDEPIPDEKSRIKLRSLSLEWLKAELALWKTIKESGPPQARPFIVQTLTHWQQDADLATVREKASLEKLAAEEQKSWKQVWVDLGDLLKGVSE